MSGDIDKKILLDTAVKRLQICTDCDRLFQKTKTCKECGCFMLLKTKVPFVDCPLGKWGKMTDENYGIKNN